MAVYNKFHRFIQDVHNGVHNLASDQIRVAFTNTLPDVDLHTVLADITQATTNADTTAVTTTSSTETGGNYSFVLVDLLITAQAGGIGPFRYVVVYNDTPNAGIVDPLIAYFDYGSSITVNDTETFLVDFGASLFTAS